MCAYLRFGIESFQVQRQTPRAKEYMTHKLQARGGGSVISFETGNVTVSRRFVDACRLFKITVSFGSCNSLVEMPGIQSHASIPADMQG